MAESYCGKCCTQCEQRIQAKCPGCRVGPGRKYGTECNIAKCCISRDLQDCDGCLSHGSCFTLRNYMNAAQSRAQAEEQSKEKFQQLRRDSRLLGRWLYVAFWLVIVSTIVNAAVALLGQNGDIQLYTNVASIVVGIMNALIFLKIAASSEWFRLAGIYGIVGTLLSVIMLFVTTQLLVVLGTLAVAVCSFIYEYQQFMGYIEVTEEIDDTISQKWSKLWLFYMICLGAAIGAVVLALLGSVLAALASLLALVSALGAIPIAVIKVVYLYRSAMIFRRYAQNTQLQQENS